MKSLFRLKKSILISLIFLILFESSCAHVARVKIPSAPQRIPAHLLEYYRYPRVQTKPSVTTVRSHPLYTEKKVIFNVVRDTTGHRSPLVIQYFEPNAKKRHPLILLIPILGKNYAVERSFAIYFANHGLASAIVNRRRLRVIPNQPLSELEAYLRSSIIRVRIALDWLEQQDRVDPKQIGTFGFSFGGILDTVLAGIEPRTKCHLIALAGGELADVICYSHEKTISRYRSQFMKKKGITLEKFREELRAAIVSDPITFAHYVDTRNVFLFIAMFDLVIGKKHSRKLAKALGNPEIYYVPLGHLTSVLAVPFVRIKSLEFFETHLKKEH